MLAWEPIVDALARQAPLWEPRSAHGYHAVTYGNLVGEVVRRVDGRSLGTFFAEEIARPLGLDFYIGLPEELEPRVAMLVGNLGSLGGGDGELGGPDMDPETRASLEALVGPTSMLGRALSVNGALGRIGDTPTPGGNVFNSRAVHAAEIPAADGITDARSLARMYAGCLGEVDGVRLLSEERMRDAATQRTSGPNIVILNMDLQFGLGYFVRSSLIQLGGPASFGHAGAGGSLGWADPDAELACGYVMNRMDLGLAGDLRSYSLVNACYDGHRLTPPRTERRGTAVRSNVPPITLRERVMSERYTIISADCHAGGSHEQYREYLDPAYLDEFDAWRNKYKNPFRDLQDGGRIRNWDDDRRIGDLEADGSVARGRLPEHGPAVLPELRALRRAAEAPSEYEHRLAGIQRAQPLAGRLLRPLPRARAGIGQIFLNDIDDAIDDVHWIKEHGLRGGMPAPNARRPTCDVASSRCYDPAYDRLWKVCEDLGVAGQHARRHRRCPTTASTRRPPLLFITEVVVLLAAPVRAAHARRACSSASRT